MKPIHPNTYTALGVIALLAAFFMGQFLDSPSDWEAEKASAASLRDALAQQQAQRPEIWGKERKARADRAVEIAAKDSTWK